VLNQVYRDDEGYVARPRQSPVKPDGRVERAALCLKLLKNLTSKITLSPYVIFRQTFDASREPSP
jgi:hypothetical protein